MELTRRRGANGNAAMDLCQSLERSPELLVSRFRPGQLLAVLPSSSADLRGSKEHNCAPKRPSQ